MATMSAASEGISHFIHLKKELLTRLLGAGTSPSTLRSEF